MASMEHKEFRRSDGLAVHIETGTESTPTTRWFDFEVKVDSSADWCPVKVEGITFEEAMSLCEMKKDHGIIVEWRIPF